MGFDNMKKCSVCSKQQPFKNYHRSKKSKDGYGYRCKDCDRQARHDYKEKNKERFALLARGRQLKWKYGITLEEYDAMFEKQGKKCAVCEATENKGLKQDDRSWSVDHCHTTGQIRGILCNNCNRAIGLLQDSKEIVYRAAEYLGNTIKERLTNGLSC